jgi:hypothetical protein
VPSPPWMYTSMSTRQPTVISTVQAIEPTARKPPNVTAAVASPASPSSLRRCESESVPQGVCSSRVSSCSSGSMRDDIPASDSSGGGGATTTAAAAAGCSRLGGDGVTAVTAPPSRSWERRSCAAACALETPSSASQVGRTQPGRGWFATVNSPRPLPAALSPPAKINNERRDKPRRTHQPPTLDRHMRAYLASRAPAEETPRPSSSLKCSDIRLRFSSSSMFIAHAGRNSGVVIFLCLGQGCGVCASWLMSKLPLSSLRKHLQSSSEPVRPGELPIIALHAATAECHPAAAAAAAAAGWLAGCARNVGATCKQLTGARSRSSSPGRRAGTASSTSCNRRSSSRCNLR